LETPRISSHRQNLNFPAGEIVLDELRSDRSGNVVRRKRIVPGEPAALFRAIGLGLLFAGRPRLRPEEIDGKWKTKETVR
jgi:hypothetical protein